MKSLIRKGLENRLPPGYDIDTHFKPRYNPWDQRLCLVPDGDLFEAIGDGRASIVTDRIRTITETGIELESGAELEADLIVTATGLNLLPFGGLEIVVDGDEVELPKTLGYKGMMLSGVPNFAAALGLHERIVDAEMRSHLRVPLPPAPPHGRGGHCASARRSTATRRCIPEPFIDFSSGYVLRAIDRFPKQGSKKPWRLHQNYARDLVALRFNSLTDDAMVFSNPEPAEPELDRLAA